MNATGSPIALKVTALLTDSVTLPLVGIYQGNMEPIDIFEVMYERISVG